MVDSSLIPFSICAFPLLSGSEKYGSLILNIFVYLLTLVVCNQPSYHVSHLTG